MRSKQARRVFRFGCQLHFAVGDILTALLRIDTTSIALHPPAAINTISIGLGALSPELPSIKILWWPEGGLSEEREPFNPLYALAYFVTPTNFPERLRAYNKTFAMEGDFWIKC